MRPKARVWIGATILAVIMVNYAFIGFPLLSKANSINRKYKTILMNQVRSGSMFINSDDEYLLEVFRKEKTSIDTKLTVLNSAAATLTFFTLSWTAFGLLFKRK